MLKIKVERKLNAIIAIQIILTMTLYYFVFVGVTAVTYALDVVQTNHENIDISAYFMNQDGEKVDKIEKNIDQDEYLYVEVSVKNEGYFNGNITLSNNNFNIKQDNSSPDIDEISGNTVKLKQINAGTTKTIKLGIEAKRETTIKAEDLNAKTAVELQGEYINSKNIEKNSYVEISGKTEVEVDWKSSEETKNELKGTLLTNNVYQINKENKRIVQFLINDKITNNNYPVKDTKISLNVPDDVEDVKVHTRYTNATNKNMEFNESNYEYSKAEKKVTINLANDNQDGLSWEQDAEDEIVITYVLDADKDINGQEISLDSTIETYDDKVLSESQIINVDEEIDGVITSNLETEEKSIYKGRIYTGEDRDYTISTKINIDYLNTTNEITIKGNSARYLENEIGRIANIIYKQTEIDKNEFLKIFGEDGFITIKDNTGTILANINKDTEANEEGKIVVNYQNNINDITIQTSNPVNLGILNIKNIKTIKNANYVREEISNFTGIEETETVNEKNTECEIELKETKSEANIKLDTAKISTLSDNQTLTVDATLLANDESKDLYKNPNVVITFPRELEVTSVQYASLYKNGLEVENATYYKNDNNQTEVNLQFVGEQTNYDISGGTRVCLKAEVKAGKLTPSQMTEVQMKYTNENKNVVNTVKTDLKLESQYGLMLYNKLLGYNKNNESIETIDKEPVYGSLDINSSSMDSSLQTALINNYEEQIQNVTLIGKIPSKGEGENTFNMTLNGIGTNNSNAKIYYSDNLNDKQSDDEWSENSENAKMYKIVILTMEPGEILAIKTNLGVPENLKTNENGNILSDVTYEINGISQSNNSKMIVKTGDKAESEETKNNQNVSSNPTTVTSQGLDVKVTAQIGNNDIANGDAIKEGETIKYNIKITNNTGKDYSNINVKAVQKNGYMWDFVTKRMKVNSDISTYEEMDTKWFEITDSNEKSLGTISTLKNGESIELSYQSSTYLLNDSKIDGTETYGNIYLQDESGEVNTNIETLKNTIQSAKIKLSVFNTLNEEYIWSENKDLTIRIETKNLENKEAKNLDVKLNLCKEISDTIDIDNFDFILAITPYIKENGEDVTNRNNLSFENIQKNEKGEITINFKILSIAALDTQNIIFHFFAKNINDTNDNIWALASIDAGDDYDYSFKFEKKVKQNSRNIGVKIDGFKNGEKINSDTKLNNDDIVDIVATIENKDTKDGILDIGYYLDENLDIQDIYLNDNDDVKSKLEDNDLKLSNISIKSGEKIEIRARVKVDGTNTNKIKNTISIDEIETNIYNSASITFLVNQIDIPDNDTPGEPDNPSTPDNPNNPNNPNTPDDPAKPNDPANPNDSDNKNSKYSISGMAWIDENKDGKKASLEKKVSQMKVSAINTKTNKIEASTTTDSSGKYTLNLPSGTYIIIFYFDNEVYTTTTYKASGVTEEQNSNAVEKEISLDGKTITVGATDTLTLNSDLSDINIGLVAKDKFNLDIQKYVSKITVKNSAGTKVYDQKDGTTLAKAEIKSKNLKGSLVVIEYKFKITNNGDIEGYAKKVEDNLPTTLTFNSSMNSDWYTSGNELYNSSLANTLIKPGETKELTLVLTKTMTEANTGLINNKAQITESSNTKGIDMEKQSTGSANVIISVSTGAMVNYIVIVIATFIILSLGAYLFVSYFKIK